jgi:hypothetical protein
MAKTVIGLVDNDEQARQVVDELLRNGFDKKDVGVITREVVQETGAAVSGATRGIVYGSLTGLLLGVIALALPGVGPIVAAGAAVPLLGATAGAIAGGLIGGLVAKGMPEHDAHLYAEGLRRGGTLIIVNARTDELAARAEAILTRHGAVDPAERERQWRTEGWSGRFAPNEQQPASASRAGAPGMTSTGRASPEAEAATAPTSNSMATDASMQREASVAGAATAAQAPADTATPIAAGAIGEPAVAISTVRVYSFVIDEQDVMDELSTGDDRQSRYTGPERRVRNLAYSGVERRRAA